MIQMYLDIFVLATLSRKSNATRSKSRPRSATIIFSSSYSAHYVVISVRDEMKSIVNVRESRKERKEICFRATNTKIIYKTS